MNITIICGGTGSSEIQYSLNKINQNLKLNLL